MRRSIHDVFLPSVPKVIQISMKTSFRVLPKFAAAQTKDGAPAVKVQSGADQIAFQRLMQGIHF
jgi:hypothetical protein